MAQVLTAYIYGIDGPGGNTDISAAGGQLNAFSVVGTHFYPTSDVRGAAQVTCQSVIEVAPTGLNQKSTKYYTAATVATLVTASNA